MESRKQASPDEELEGERVLLEGDPEQKTEQVLEYAKDRFRKWIKRGLESPEVKAATRKRKRKVRADTFNALADVAGMTMEEQVMMQIACLTQGVVDCATRASSEPIPDEEEEQENAFRYGRSATATPDARRSYRAAELQNQTYMAHATARLVDTVARFQGKAHVRHEFTYQHLHRQTPQQEQVDEEPEMTTDQSAENITKYIFDGVSIEPVADDPPPPPTSE